MQESPGPLGANLVNTILPARHSSSDTRRLLLYFRKDAQGRFIMGGRGAMGDASIRTRQAALWVAAERLYPQLQGAEWLFAWGADVALTRDHLPGLHRLFPRMLAALGYNGRGVGIATAMGMVLIDWALGRPEAELNFPVTQPRPIPFHRFRRAGLGATVAVSRLLHRLGALSMLYLPAHGSPLPIDSRLRIPMP